MRRIFGDRSRYATGHAATGTADATHLRGKPWIAMQWDCCSVYSRLYRNAAGTAYEGHCPKCARPVSVKIGPAGTDTRFFRAS